MIRTPTNFLALGFGTGLSPFAPGTAGTLPGVIICLLLAGMSLPVYLLVTLACAIAGVWICDRASRDLGVHDHGGIVWDEIAGFLVTMIAVPVTPATLIGGFFVFRLFDVWKPGPIRSMDTNITGGLGIMVDDLAAGALSCLVLHLLIWGLPGVFL